MQMCHARNMVSILYRLTQQTTVAVYWTLGNKFHWNSNGIITCKHYRPLGLFQHIEIGGCHYHQGIISLTTVNPKKYAHGFVVLYFVVVMQSFIMNSHEVFIHIYQGCFAGTGAIVRLPQCQWSKPDGYEKISQCTVEPLYNTVHYRRY